MSKMNRNLEVPNMPGYKEVNGVKSPSAKSSVLSFANKLHPVSRQASATSTKLTEHITHL